MVAGRGDTLNCHDVLIGAQPDGRPSRPERIEPPTIGPAVRKARSPDRSDARTRSGNQRAYPGLTADVQAAPGPPSCPRIGPYRQTRDGVGNRPGAARFAPHRGGLPQAVRRGMSSRRAAVKLVRNSLRLLVETYREAGWDLLAEPRPDNRLPGRCQPALARGGFFRAWNANAATIVLPHRFSW